MKQLGTIFIMAGRSGSGKTALSKWLAEKLGISHTSFGNVVRTEAKSCGLSDANKAVLQKLGQRLVDEELERFCDLVLKSLSYAPHTSGVIDGLRHTAVYTHLQKVIGKGKIKLLFVTVEDGLRFERLHESRGWTKEQCQLYDDDPTEQQLESDIRNQADLVIHNNGDFEDSTNSITEWLNKHD